jgi:alkaline phosphatase
MKGILTAVCCLFCLALMAQPAAYSTANAHSHNDYEKLAPFNGAYKAGFGSVEADLHLINDTLWVAHDKPKPGMVLPTFESIYLKPLQQMVAKNGGYPYADHSKKLQLLIDLKTNGDTTLPKVVAAIQQYPDLSRSKNIYFVISGSRPDPAIWGQYPSFIWFDGNIGQTYTAPALRRIALMSADFHKISKWTGLDTLPAKDKDTLQLLIQSVHKLGKPIRFWASPDNEEAWKQFIQWKIDYLNTDRIDDIAAFLSTQKP